MMGSRSSSSPLPASVDWRSLSFCGQPLPKVIVAAGEDAVRRFLTFFTAKIRKSNDPVAYARAVNRFCRWCKRHGSKVDRIEATTVAEYVEEMQSTQSALSVKQSLAAVRTFYEGLVIAKVVPVNPATSVRAPRFVAKSGELSCLSAGVAQSLLDNIQTFHRISRGHGFLYEPDFAGLRDRALIAVMLSSSASAAAVVRMNVADYYRSRRQKWIRVHDDDGKFHVIAAHQKVETCLDEYLIATLLDQGGCGPLFRTLDRHLGRVSSTRLSCAGARQIIKRRTVEARRSVAGT